MEQTISVGVHGRFATANSTVERYGLWAKYQRLVKNVSLRFLKKVSQRSTIHVGIESTGTYGDPLRQAMADANLVVHQVRSKLTHDYAEIFDGVPSQHDGEDAAVIAELVAQGKSRPWPFLSPQETDDEIQYQVKRMLESGRDFERQRGKLEGLIAKHWPELTSLITLASPLMLRLLRRYGSPAEVARDKDIMARMNSFSYGLLSEEKRKQIVLSAKRLKGCGSLPGASNPSRISLRKCTSCTQLERQCGTVAALACGLRLPPRRGTEEAIGASAEPQ